MCFVCDVFGIVIEDQIIMYIYIVSYTYTFSSIDMLTIIAALSRNRVIGHNNRLPWHIPGDMKHFKELTLHHTILMGRKTYESIGMLLPHRHTLILSSTLKPEDIFISSDQHTSYTLLKNREERTERYATHRKQHVFIVGGGEIYKQFLPLVDGLELTLIDQEIQ